MLKNYVYSGRYNVYNKELRGTNTRNLEFGTRIGFKQHDIILTKEQPDIKNNKIICKRKNTAAT